MNYYEKLETPMWINTKREPIKERDGYKCIACGNDENVLVVHHIKYRGEPWDIGDEWLQTLCWQCHNILGEHPKAGIAYVKNTDGLGLVYYHCPNCGMCKESELVDKGTYAKCGKCSYRFVSENTDVTATYFEFTT
jgi:uncharacterized CHY-type Zn-finger protein